ncbi:hypothetical protein BpHYR1_016902 [Brachionus plicatilis]|uniref:Uncharacterized protein n=1 Tax=Brachionus plicatilis TaxID=10195 RepID=A0A3M7RG38_BRAPC|nr:hypothetical protein BpHYR1_016902 [Brachionus plicatilis]
MTKWKYISEEEKVPLGSSERRSAFFSASLYIEDLDLSKTVLNFCCGSFGLLESTLCIKTIYEQKKSIVISKHLKQFFWSLSGDI